MRDIIADQQGHSATQVASSTSLRRLLKRVGTEGIDTAREGGLVS
jgi:hypothetical protein